MKQLIQTLLLVFTTCSLFGAILITGPSGGGVLTINPFTASGPVVNTFLLSEDSSFLLLEDNAQIILE